MFKSTTVSSCINIYHNSSTLKLKTNQTSITNSNFNNHHYKHDHTKDSKYKVLREKINVISSEYEQKELVKKVVQVKNYYSTMSSGSENYPSNKRSILSGLVIDLTHDVDDNSVDLSRIDNIYLNEISSINVSDTSDDEDVPILKNTCFSPISIEDNSLIDLTINPSCVIEIDRDHKNTQTLGKDADTIVVDMGYPIGMTHDCGDKPRIEEVDNISIQDSSSYDNDSSSDESCVITHVSQDASSSICGRKNVQTTNMNNIDCQSCKTTNDFKQDGVGDYMSLRSNDVNVNHSSESCLDFSSFEDDIDDIHSVIYINPSTPKELHTEVRAISSDSDDSIDVNIFTEIERNSDLEMNIQRVKHVLSNWLSNLGKQVSSEKIHQIAVLFLKLAKRCD